MKIALQLNQKTEMKNEIHWSDIAWVIVIEELIYIFCRTEKTM